MTLDQRSYEEKRDFIRVPVDCDVSLCAKADGRRFTATGKNLSAGGVLFHTDETLNPGDCLEMHIEANQVLVSVLDASIEVVRVEPVGGSGTFAVGGAITAMHSQ